MRVFHFFIIFFKGKKHTIQWFSWAISPWFFLQKLAIWKKCCGFDVKSFIHVEGVLLLFSRIKEILFFFKKRRLCKKKFNLKTFLVIVLIVNIPNINCINIFQRSTCCCQCFFYAFFALEWWKLFSFCG